MVNGMDNSYNADKIFRAGKQAEKKENWQDAYQLFEKATFEYEQELDSEQSAGRLKADTAVYYLRSRSNSLLNLFRFEFDDADEFDIHHAIQKIYLYQKERRKRVKEFPHALERCFSIERSFFNKLEESLSNNGLKAESSQICYLNQKLETEVFLNRSKAAFRKKKVLSGFENALKYAVRSGFFYVYLGYGVKVRHLIISAICIIFVFGVLYSATHSIEITKLENSFDLLSGLFASLMTFIGFDFDEVAPICNLGRILVSIEGVLGFITFGGIIAYIWRKLK